MLLTLISCQLTPPAPLLPCPAPCPPPRLLQVYYRGTSRQLRRLEAVSLSPLYAAFGEVVDGAPAIRAAGAQGWFMHVSARAQPSGCLVLVFSRQHSMCVPQLRCSTPVLGCAAVLGRCHVECVASPQAPLHAMRIITGYVTRSSLFCWLPSCPPVLQSFSKLLVDNQLTAMSGAAASNWLTARLQLLAAVLVSAVAGLAAYTSYSFCMEAAAAAGGGVAPALGKKHARSGSDMEEFRVYLIGLCLAYCLPIVALLNGLLTSSAETEQEMVAVERVKEFIDSAVSEEPRVGAHLRRQLSKPLSQQHTENSWAQRVQRSQSAWWSNSPASSISPAPSAARIAALRQVVAAGSGRLANVAGYAIGGGLRLRRAAKRLARKQLPATASLVTGTGLTQPLYSQQPGAVSQEEQQDRGSRQLGRTVSAPAHTSSHSSRQGQQVRMQDDQQQQQQQSEKGIPASQQQQQQDDGHNADEQQPSVSLQRSRASSGSEEVSVRAESVASGAVSCVSAGNWLMDDTDDSDEEHVTISMVQGSSPRGVRFARGHARGSATSCGGGMGYAQPGVKFEEVTMSYSLAARPALRNVSFEVSLGQTLGICGRTGAGKSSLLAALLRLNPIQAGHITLHGQDIYQLPLAELRGRFGVMPQTPLLFEGTVRDNLDPFGNCKDEDLASALQAVRLWEVLCRLALERGVLMKGSYLAARRGRSMGLSRSSAAAQQMGVGGKSIRAQAWESISRGDQQQVGSCWLGWAWLWWHTAAWCLPQGVCSHSCCDMCASWCLGLCHPLQPLGSRCPPQDSVATLHSLPDLPVPLAFCPQVLVTALSSMPLVAQLEQQEEQQQQDMWRGPVVAVLGMQVGYGSRVQGG